MSITPTYPGVYVVEVPSGARTLTGVATSVAAFVGRALRGPVDEPVALSSWSDFERVFGGLWRASGLGYAVRDFYLNGGSQALVVRVSRGADTVTVDAGGLALTATGPGAWANRLSVVVRHPAAADAAEVAAGQGVEPDDLFVLEVRESDDADALSETFVNVTVVDGPRRVDRVLAASALVRAGAPLPGARPAEGTYAAAAAVDDGTAPGREEYAGDQFARRKRGIYALLKADLFTLLCLPPPSPSGDLPEDLWALAAQFCHEQKAMLLVDPPAGMTTTQVQAWPSGTAGLSGVATRNAALYFPRIRRPDPLRGGSSADFVPCGAVAGVMARTDGARGVWKAAAGTEAALAGVTGLALPLTDAENGELNPRGINCLRTFRGIGPVVWGARTLRGSDALADEYRYVPVRRLALHLEQSLYRGTQWVVFEPNDAPLWSQIRASCGGFMQDLFRRGAFQGSSPRDAYFVRCDAETTTQYDIDRGVVNILIGFAPLKPAEFVVIGIQQKTAAASA